MEYLGGWNLGQVDREGVNEKRVLSTDVKEMREPALQVSGGKSISGRENSNNRGAVGGAAWHVWARRTLTREHSEQEEEYGVVGLQVLWGAVGQNL